MALPYPRPTFEVVREEGGGKGGRARSGVEFKGVPSGATRRARGRGRGIEGGKNAKKLKMNLQRNGA